MKKEFSVQDILSIGYLYLIVLGIFSDLIYYKFIGINILYYSDILDIILAPINILATNVPILCLFIVLIVISYFSNKKGENSFSVISVTILLLFLGFGIGKGFKANSKIQDNDINSTHELTFNDGKKEEVKIVGQKSSYLFYIQKGQKEVSVSPVANIILKIKKL